MELSQKEQDIQQMLSAQCHLGTKNCDYQMERYVYRRRNDGIHIINLGKTWEKLQLAARVIVAIENPQDVAVLSARPYGQRAVLKFAQYTGTKALVGRFTPGELMGLDRWRTGLTQYGSVTRACTRYGLWGNSATAQASVSASPRLLRIPLCGLACVGGVLVAARPTSSCARA